MIQAFQLPPKVLAVALLAEGDTPGACNALAAKSLDAADTPRVRAAAVRSLERLAHDDRHAVLLADGEVEVSGTRAEERVELAPVRLERCSQGGGRAVLPG